jgi:hypothetical protein
MPPTDPMIRVGTAADLVAVADIYRRASLSNDGDRDRLLAHPEYRSRGAATLEVTASPDALSFYRSVGFIDVGVARPRTSPAAQIELTW